MATHCVRRHACLSIDGRDIANHGDAHWTTDVLAGAVVGLGAGFGIPYLLHYGTVNGVDDKQSARRIPWNMALIPIGTDEMLGAGVIGYF